ncbi:D-alanyl-D-alanine carboxypeptidase [Anseongella ginsenosidimutans]|uniref:D-alanyl-D-alanine carboxypeptidase n=1 Tax=Anseongella ginsenosidimutans TaxID=496056 RepID=A0A4R3KMF7_9SPHI|nr:serine hydrolase domain-containing protein [Anseongella ginsenosidimutans]QEC53823.1 beta-lactamase family protein [Anseongella ginsenosidimutans]TCS84970.1 D-alanyl-D-alanine carboxypeptidase [Anseongella ginsenosidimutans]
MKTMEIARLLTWKTMVLFIVLAVMCKSVAAQDLNTSKLDELLTYLEDRNEAMGSLAISKNGKLLYARSIGYRSVNNDKKIPADRDTKYRIWSITKIFTATMILQLIEEGNLKLETTLDQFFPRIANADSITILHMLNHKSGIHDFTDPGPENSSSPDSQTQARMVDLISMFKPDFRPGERFQYSNSNFLLLGYIVEKLDEVTYSAALRNRISSRIGLSDTYYGLDALRSIENKAFTYRLQEGQWIAVNEGDFSAPVPGGAGSIVSTPSDMVKFIESLFSGRLITENSLAQMTNISEFYGLGIHLVHSQSSAGFGHGGGYLGSYSNLAYYPQDRLAIAYCTNGQVYEMDKILYHVLQICYDKSYVLPFNRPSIQLSKNILQKYAGIYETPKFLLTVTMEGNHLTAQPAGQQKSTLAAFAENGFFTQEFNIEITFGSDKTGKTDSVFIRQGDRKMAGKKIK